MENVNLLIIFKPLRLETLTGFGYIHVLSHIF